MLNEGRDENSGREIPETGEGSVEYLLRAADLQAQLGLSRAKVYRLMRENVLPTVRIGGSIRVPRKALIRWLEEHTLPGAV